MDIKSELIEFFKFTEVFGFSITERESKILIQKHPISLVVERIEENAYYFYMYYKTSSWVIDGERTDIHELIPVIIAIFTRTIENINFSMINEANSFSGIETEISSTYLIPTQPQNSKFKLTTHKSFQNFKKIFMSIMYSIVHVQDFLQITCKNQFQESYDDEELINWYANINKILKTNSSHSQYIKRTNPSYFYYRNIKLGLTIIKSKGITENLLATFNSKYKYKKVEGINNYLLINDTIKNVVYHNRLNLVKKTLKKLDNLKSNHIIPFDNFCILVGTEHFIIFTNYGGLNDFLNEKEKIRKRYLNETFNLFYEMPIEWSIKTAEDTAIFEDLILELLEKENGILAVKKVAPTNQPDNGRDLIAYYTEQYINPHIPVANIHTNIVHKQLIVQCKTRLNDSKKQSIGKNDVGSISDALFDYTPNGYLLVTNTQITRDLTEYLEKIKKRNTYDIQWWNRFDIEKRLRENPEIMTKYSQIVKFSS